MNNSELFLKTLFCCSACDGDIAQEEINLVKNVTAGNVLFEDINVEERLNQYIESINSIGQKFLKEYLYELDESAMSEEEQLTLLELAIKMIEADNQILYSELKFFKKIRQHLNIADDVILNRLPQSEEYLLPDIASEDKDEVWTNISFAPIDFSIPS